MMTILLYLLLNIILVKSQNAFNCGTDPCPSLFCNYGRFIDDKGCPTCYCNASPCLDTLCEENEQCHVVRDTNSQYVPQCVLITVKNCSAVNCGEKICRFGFLSDEDFCPTCNCDDPCMNHFCLPNYVCDLANVNCPPQGCIDPPMPYCKQNFSSSSTTAQQGPPVANDSPVFPSAAITPTGEMPTTDITTPSDSGMCNLPMDLGICKAAIPMWFYNMTSSQCEPFTHGGCGGNNNLFPTWLTCMQVCQPDALPSTQSLFTTTKIGDPCPSDLICTGDLVCLNRKDSNGNYLYTDCVSRMDYLAHISASTTTSRSPCPQLMCTTNCATSGYVTNSNGCATCDCVDPCEGVNCGKGKVCKYEACPRGIICTPFSGPVCIQDCPNTLCPLGYASATSCLCNDPCENIAECPNGQICRRIPNNISGLVMYTAQCQNYFNAWQMNFTDPSIEPVTLNYLQINTPTKMEFVKQLLKVRLESYGLGYVARRMDILELHFSTNEMTIDRMRRRRRQLSPSSVSSSTISISGRANLIALSYSEDQDYRHYTPMLQNAPDGVTIFVQSADPAAIPWNTNPKSKPTVPYTNDGGKLLAIIIVFGVFVPIATAIVIALIFFYRRRLREFENRGNPIGCISSKNILERKKYEEMKKEKSTDCDSALIPLHCVHG